MARTYNRNSSKQTVSPEEILVGIKSNQPDSLYLIYGENQVQVKKYINEILDLLLPKEYRDGNLLVQDSKTFSVTDIIDFCDTLPFLASRRVVLIENCPLLQESKRSPKKLDEASNLLLSWLDSHKDEKEKSYCLLFSFVEDTEKSKLYTSNKLYKFISKQGIVSECPLSESIQEFINACSQNNIPKSLEKLEKLFAEGIDSSELGYQLMGRLRYPLKRDLSGSNYYSKREINPSIMEGKGTVP